MVRHPVAVFALCLGIPLVLFQAGSAALGAESPAANLILPAAGGRSLTRSATYPPIAELVDHRVLVEHNGVKAHVGYGSSLAIDPADPNRFYLLTDRGPNVDIGKDHIVFLMPSFAPRIGHFRLDGKSLAQVSVIELKDDQGRKLSGLPRKRGEGGTGEVPEDVAGKVLDFDANGIDPEGLVALRDGTFWISDEYLRLRTPSTRTRIYFTTLEQ